MRNILSFHKKLRYWQNVPFAMCVYSMLSWNNLSQNSDHDDYTVYVKVALTMEIIATNSIKLTMKQFDYFAWEYFEYRIWVVGVAPWYWIWEYFEIACTIFSLNCIPLQSKVFWLKIFSQCGNNPWNLNLEIETCDTMIPEIWWRNFKRERVWMQQIW